MSKVIVVGGGPAGMMAAYAAAQNGHRVFLLEKNEKLGKKLYITGKGRCNVTNAGDMDVLFQNVMTNRKFLYSAFYTFDNRAVMEFFEKNHTPLKIERGGRVFPVSDHSSDIIAACERALQKNYVTIQKNTMVLNLIIEENLCVGVRIKDGSSEKELKADSVILATGGLSYPSTGSTGDGYLFSASSGHRIVEPVPSLVPFETKEDWVKSLQGLSLKNTAIRIMNGKKRVYEDFGEMLFTHFGISGPMILSASATLRSDLFQNELSLFIDLKPALDFDTLDKRVIKDFDEAKNKTFKNAIVHLFPAKMIPVIVELSGIDGEKKVHDISREERHNLVQLIKNLPVTIVRKRGFSEAIITKGGINVKDVDPSTMQSKIVSNLYFCGEVLDLDALTGGYNLQIAWSTGYLAGFSVE